MVVAKKTVFVKLEFGVRRVDQIPVIIDWFRRAAKKFGGCDCFDLWHVEVDGIEHDPDSPGRPV